MKEEIIPIPIARLVMKAMPSVMLQHITEVLLKNMMHNHPKLYHNLSLLDPSVVLIKPIDVPQCFVLKIGGGGVSISVGDNEDGLFHASIKGKLSVLIDLLEGRVDGDMSFFSRDLEITGDTSVIVALRNTLDREEICLLNDAASMFGPFSSFFRQVLIRVKDIGQQIESHYIEKHNYNYVEVPNKYEAECNFLRDEVKMLNARLAKIKIHQRKRQEAVL